MSQGGEKTEKPTAKRLREARKRGQLAKSQDLTAAALFVVAVIVLWLAGGYMSGHLMELMRDHLARAAEEGARLDRTTALQRMNGGIRAMAYALAPLLGALIAIGGLVAYLQVGSLFAFESLKPSAEKLNPVANFKQKFLKSRAYIELAKTILKLAVAVVVISNVLWNARVDLIQLAHQPIRSVGAFTMTIILEIGVKVGAAFLLLGAGDWFLQRFLHRREMMMTKQEVKEEYKESEGNPQIKGARRAMHRQILMESMMAAVRRADVVVVNPTHLAVAIKYDRETMSAPQVTAKGADLIAAKMREIAADAGVPVMRDVPLARQMYELDIEEEVPEQLYEAVAVVLRWVYDLEAERSGVTRVKPAKGAAATSHA